MSNQYAVALERAKQAGETERRRLTMQRRALKAADQNVTSRAWKSWTPLAILGGVAVVAFVALALKRRKARGGAK